MKSRVQIREVESLDSRTRLILDMPSILVLSLSRRREMPRICAHLQTSEVTYERDVSISPTHSFQVQVSSKKIISINGMSGTPLQTLLSNSL